MKLNVPVAPIHTHGGARAKHINPELQLRRSVMACMLWEDEFYESGDTIAARVCDLVKEVLPEKVAAIAIEARSNMNLRHVPLLVVREMSRLPSHRGLVASTLAEIIQRPDELSEFLAIYWKEKKQPLTAQVKRGLAKAFTKFDAYSLAKYNRDGAIKLRDVLFMCHAKPKDEAQAVVWKQLVDGTLPVPDTWEVSLSSGADKKASWERLLAEGKLGALALIRNLRNMEQAGVAKATVSTYANKVDLRRVIPFRYVAASKAVPAWEDICDAMLLRGCSQRQKLGGKTVIVVDVSGSMYSAGNISKNSDMTRVDAAGALAAILREVCEDARVYATAGNDGSRIHATVACPPRRGMALVETFTKQKYMPILGSGGIFLVQCLSWVKEREKSADRIIVLTDEQDCDRNLQPDKADAFATKNYLINVASAKNGIGYGKWTHIDGWSEAVVDYIVSSEMLVD